MAQVKSSERSRWSLIASVLIIGFISLVQPGCNCGTSSGTAVPAPVASVFPTDNSTTALVDTNVIAFFGIDMNGPSVESSFTLTESGGTDQPAAVIYDATTQSAILDPITDLKSGTEYRATISSTVEDAAGNSPLTSDFVWSFTVSQATELISKDDNGVVGNDVSSKSAIDGTGRYIVFESEATNLASALTTINRNHIYRKDTLTGEVLLVSSDANGLEANNSNFSPRISDDGHYAVFESTATNLSSISTGGTNQVFKKDLTDGSIELVSRSKSGFTLVAANNASANPDISNDGRYIVFESNATNLSVLSTNGATQIYLKDMDDESVDMISRNTTQTAGGNSDSNRPYMSPDAQYIVFDSTAGSSLVASATAIRSIYFVDMMSPDVTELISVDSNDIQGNGASINASVNDDGNFIAFESEATNLIAGGTTISDIYRRDRAGSSTLLVSTPDGTTGGDNASLFASISRDGTYIAFESAATNLVAETVGGLTDIFVRDFSITPAVTIMKVNFSQSGAEATNNSRNASISSNGRYVSFDSAYNYDVTDTNTINDVYRSYNSTF